MGFGNAALDQYPERSGRASTTKAFLDLFFPNHCPICQERVSGARYLCPVCEKILEDMVPAPVLGEGFGKVERFYCFSDTDSVLYDLVKAYKYLPQKELAKHLAFFLFRLIDFWHASVPFIIPLPAHPASIRTRGFSNTRLILDRLKQRYIPDLTILEPAQRREWSYRPQASLTDETERKENVRDVFRLKKGTILPERIALFDDVYTTGATVAEYCRVLAPYVRRIDLFVLARRK